MTASTTATNETRLDRHGADYFSSLPHRAPEDRRTLVLFSNSPSPSAGLRSRGRLGAALVAFNRVFRSVGRDENLAAFGVAGVRGRCARCELRCRTSERPPIAPPTSPPPVPLLR